MSNNTKDDNMSLKRQNALLKSTDTVEQELVPFLTSLPVTLPVYSIETG